jgi:hypothetical protein
MKGNKLPPNVIEIADDPDGLEEGEDEIEASLKQLFPDEHEVTQVSVLGRIKVEMNLTKLTAGSRGRRYH